MTALVSSRALLLLLLKRLSVPCIALAASLMIYGCSSAVLLDERFHDTRLSNWTAVDDPDTVEGPSDWHVEPDGWLHQRTNVWGRRGDFLGRWYGTFLVGGDPDWENYSLSVKAKPTDDDGFGVVFRYQGPEHFYRLLFLQDGLSGGPIIRLDRRDGPDYTEIWSIERGYRPDVAVTIDVTVDEDLITAAVDGKQLFELRDGSYRRGKIWLFCYAQNGQAFDDVRVLKQ